MMPVRNKRFLFILMFFLGTTAKVNAFKLEEKKDKESLAPTWVSLCEGRVS